MFDDSYTLGFEWDQAAEPSLYSLLELSITVSMEWELPVATGGGAGSSAATISGLSPTARPVGAPAAFQTVGAAFRGARMPSLPDGRHGVGSGRGNRWVGHAPLPVACWPLCPVHARSLLVTLCTLSQATEKEIRQQFRRLALR